MSENFENRKEIHMKRITAFGTLVLTLLFAAAPQARAATASSGPIPVSAVVDGGLTLSVALRRNDFNGPVVTAMDFGTLVERNGTLVSSPTGSTGTGAIDAFISANSHGLPYTIRQTGTPLSNGTVNLPAGALTVTPVYAEADNGGASMPAGAVLGTPGSWVATDKLLHQSESGPTAAQRLIQAFYSITDDPAAGATDVAPTSRPAGTYTGTITITVTA